MFYIFEKPHQRPDRMWTARNLDDFLSILREVHENNGEEVYDDVTPAELLTRYNTTLEEAQEDECGWISDLYRKYGADTTLYRADFYGQPEYSPTYISPLDAAKAAAGHDLYLCFVAEGEDEARDFIPMLRREGMYNCLSDLRDEIGSFLKLPATEKIEERSLRDYGLTPNSLADWVDVITLDEVVTRIAHYKNGKVYELEYGSLIFAPDSAHAFWMSAEPSWQDLVDGDVEGWEEAPERIEAV